MDIAKYWRSVGDLEKSLPSEAYFYVTSISDEMQHRKGGVTTTVPRDLVGRLVVGGSHRLATEAEVETLKKSEHEHSVEIKMHKLNVDNQKAVEIFDALNRLTKSQISPETEPAAKKGK